MATINATPPAFVRDLMGDSDPAKARDLHANCKSCHDKYKPEKR